MLANDKFKQIVTDSLSWLHNQGRCAIYGFVTRPNHIHLLWRISNQHGRPEVQGALLSFTAHRFKEELKAADEPTLMKHFVGDTDRVFQFRERELLVKQCWSAAFLTQKLEYIITIFINLTGD